MSVYQKFVAMGSQYIGKAKLFKVGFNVSPMYRRSTARITSVSKDLLEVKIKLPISYKNRNYMNTIFGGSMFAAVDPIPMVQLINLIGDDYVVWDKSAEIYFKRPAKENLYATFQYTLAELEEIKQKVDAQKEIEIIKTTFLTNREENVVYCEVHKNIYIASKAYFKQKQAKRKEKMIAQYPTEIQKETI